MTRGQNTSRLAGKGVPDAAIPAAREGLSAAIVLWAMLACLFIAATVAPGRAFAEDDAEKHDEPVISHLVQENRDGIYRSIADWPQGTQFPFKVTGTLPDSLASYASFEYWLVAQPESTLTYISGTARVVVVHANGAEQDVTAQVTVAEVGGAIVAGATDVKAAIPGLAADDELVLYYTCEYDPSYNLGFGHGNPSWAHADYKATPATSPAPASARRVATDTRPAPSAAQSTDPRSAGLTSTPEIKATVYCYALDIVKLAGDTGEPLAGASFVLRDDDGRYYVKDQPWNDDASKATVMTSGSDGKLLFAGLDHDTYFLQETQAPSGYEKLGDIDVTIDTTIPDEVESITITSNTVTIRNANSTTGTIGINLTDPRGGTAPQPGPSSDDPVSPPPDDDQGSGGSPSGDAPGDGQKADRVRPASAAGLIAAMGDPLVVTGLAMLLVAAVLFAVGSRRKIVRGAEGSGKTPGGEGPNGWEEGNGNG